ncbi:alpha/beta-hydrolase [Ceraceosorus guamensis]|uniref:Alpha/beta-hydrolase n=1 Tax=Ceraceosorus guamensis TaxID=1522189 RepID=A0A316W294_9BASI|nr:alpha/beta-hydrolase [Ceraceosorus guamensis]PWN43880.1 alpha/beta-hydrolase [Ceraceosorus guamensis]
MARAREEDAAHRNTLDEARDDRRSSDASSSRQPGALLKTIANPFRLRIGESRKSMTSEVEENGEHTAASSTGSSSAGAKAVAPDAGDADGTQSIHVKLDSEQQRGPGAKTRSGLPSIGASRARSKLEETARRSRNQTIEAEAAAWNAPDEATRAATGVEVPGTVSPRSDAEASSANAETRNEGAMSPRRSDASEEDQGHSRFPFIPFVTDGKRPSLPFAHLPRPLIPTIPFPLQGTGKGSEYFQSDPIWAKYPWKALYYTYFGLSVGFVYLPYFALKSIPRSKRERPGWSWKQSTMVELFGHSTRLTFRTHTNFARDLSKEVPHNRTIHSKFVWVDPLPDDHIKGEIRRAMEIQKVEAVRTCGFWYGDAPDMPDRKVEYATGRKAKPDEQVVYHLHGGAYWIGTAHEDDVSAAVNKKVLSKLFHLRDSRGVPTDTPWTPGKPRDASNRKRAMRSFRAAKFGNPFHGSAAAKQRDGESQRPSASRATSTASEAAQAKLTRTFSLDYRLAVPGQPSKGSYPAALLDGLAGYRYLVRECEFKPENIIIAGDSAGGNLALAICRYLRDEKIDEMPGSLLLLSPWVDTSRSHAGPLTAPNKMSSSFTNKNSDIIPTAVGFRNTAVSALLGDLPASEAYRNGYLSSCSLQLDVHGPHWGYEGFPKRIYICSGDAEVSYDQHQTLAHRLASGTRRGIPKYVGHALSKDQDPFELAARLKYPRPQESAQAVARGTPLVNLDVQFPDRFTPAWSLHQHQNHFEQQFEEHTDVTENFHTTSNGKHVEQTEKDQEAQKSRAGRREKPGAIQLGEERTVWLDECRDAVHDYLLFSWWGKDREDTWDRIARWIEDGDV